MAPEEVVVDEFEDGDVVVVEDSAKGLTNALVFMTTLLLVVGMIIIMVAMKNWFDRGMFGSGK